MDRNVLFAFAVSANHDVLSFVPKRDGKWRLTRIRGWLDKNTIDQTIDIPGWPFPEKRTAGAGEEFLNLIDVGLFVTADGRYTVCVAGASWSREGQRGERSNKLVSVVDMADLSVVKTMRTSELGQGPWGVYMSPDGDLALQADATSTQAAPARGSPPATVNSNGAFTGGPLRQSEIRLVVLTVPNLEAAGQCEFSETVRGYDWSITDAKDACGTMLHRATNKAVPVREFIESLRDGNGFPVHRGAPTQPCRDAGVSRDGSFKKESCEKSHLTAWNRKRVTDDLEENIFSLESGKLIGSIEETTRNSVQSHFAGQNDRDYLLVMEGGGKLKVYEIVP